MHNCMAKSHEDFVAQQKHGNSGYQDELWFIILGNKYQNTFEGLIIYVDTAS
jgi:hypothetical protein